MKLIVGLGNPGRKYSRTRHNVGFEVAAELARRFATTGAKRKFQGEVVEATLDGVQALLLTPHTLMNRSGSSVCEARNFYRLDIDDVLVMCDDIHLPLAKLRLRAGGSSGGQKGLADVIRCLGTEQFSRLRIGVDEPPEHIAAADYVLGRFSKQENAEIEFAVQRAADAAVVWAHAGIESCMNQFN